MAPRPDDADSVPDGDTGTHAPDDDVTRPEDDDTRPVPPEGSGTISGREVDDTGHGPADDACDGALDGTAEDALGGTAEGTTDGTTAPGAGEGGTPTRDPDPLGDVDAQFAGIVAGLRAEVRPRSWTLDSTTAEVDDAHFEPPDPGPVLGGDPLLTVAWVAVLALPLVLLLGVLVWNPLPGIVLQTCVVGFLGGLALLLWRMPRHRDHDDPGAVV